MRTLAPTPVEAPVRPDPELPGLQRALDAVALGQELAEAWTAEDGAPPVPESGRLFYVRYKPDTSLLVGFRYRRAGADTVGAMVSAAGERLGLDDDGLPADDILGYARLLPPRRFPDALASARAVALKRSGARLFSRPATGLLFQLFPFDRALIGLRTVARRGPLKRWAATHLAWPEAGGRIRGTASTVDLLRYKPERRAVFGADLVWENAGRDRLERHPLLIKSYAPGEGARTWSVMRRLAAAAPEGITLAEPLGWSPEERLLVQSRVPGTPLFDPAGGGAAGTDSLRRLRAVGAALLGLQRVTPPEAFREPPGGAAWVDRTLDETGRLGPHLERLGAEPAAELGARLHAALRRNRPAAVRPTLIHGDFYHHQILIDGGRVGIVDFDEAALDDPRIDAGNFLAHLDLERLRSTGATPGAGGDGALGEAFVAGYVGAGGAGEGLAWFRAAGLARLALVPFRNLRPGWRAAADALLSRALELLS